MLLRRRHRVVGCTAARAHLRVRAIAAAPVDSDVRLAMKPARREFGGGGAQFVAEDEVGAQLGVVGGALGGPRDRLAK